MCDKCDANPVDHGEVVPGLRLMVATTTIKYPDSYWKADEWSLLDSSDTAVIVWNDPNPQVDPQFDMTDDEIEEASREQVVASLHAIEANARWGRNIRYVAGMVATSQVLQTITESGWTLAQGAPEHYLAHKVALLMRAMSAKQSEDK